MATNLINRSEVKKALVQQAVDTSYYWREVVGPQRIRVSAQTLEEAQAAVQNWIRYKVLKSARKGMTL